MDKYIVFNAEYGQYIVYAENWIRATQAALMAIGGTADDWTAHKVSEYSETYQKRFDAECEVIQ